MGIFFSDKKASTSDDPDSFIRGAGGNPDDRPRWGKITPTEFRNHAMRRLRQKLGMRKASIIETAVHGNLEEGGRQHGMDVAELDETMETLSEERHHLGLTKENLTATKEILEKDL